MKKHKLKDDTMNESQRYYNYAICPRDSKLSSDEGFVNNDDSSINGTHWTCFLLKDNKSFYFDSFGGTPDKFLLKQLTKPRLYHKCKIQDINSKVCVSYCLYFIFLFERTNYYAAILKTYFEDHFL